MHDAYAGGEVLAEVVRSGFVEGYHRGSVIVLDPSGRVVAAAGQVDAPIFPRSSSKPLQSVGLLRAGMELPDPADLAVVAASHFGEPMHVARVKAILGSAGLSEDDLACPPDLPLSEAARVAVWRAGGDRKRITMNCSGKHAGMLVTCRVNGWPTDGYFRADHPVQQVVRDAVEDLAGEKAAAVGVDGCGAPVLAISLHALAAGVQRMVLSPVGTPERRVADAMRTYPELVSGTDADDARLMHAIPGLLAKGGAEGVLVVAIPQAGAVAVKIDDGAARARLPVLASALRRLGVATADLAGFDETPVYGRGEQVGAVRSRW